MFYTRFLHSKRDFYVLHVISSIYPMSSFYARFLFFVRLFLILYAVFMFYMRFLRCVRDFLFLLRDF